ncbi:alkaline phosphatase family protein [Halalkalicoccus jeotgali]|uniref:Type I phosphodiesterase/nucleotide pyrophosphatase n=1 Tax=Halalkalicoccus jeotgali (strain DSM 18796 / CECT 7217 / JCM 14584 / KCTC 4019 / B3) TaxID=795797 RepID=D8J454_HALJB|nr:alkaline phosphatase family protein [Halalkalicoccus jeotgali]ADJ15446.1 type I phosphodiesterase/nucleotide pyrophosphatase [Halalkalicoccus jeotgali B3]ELY36145.1 type I phosphodiesterase/nucleotide pyrophosphatase [Halalkalicoccus jeotgali B3]
MKTLVIGLDAACERVLDPLLESGVLSNLASLVEEGASGPLESQIPPWTPSAWPSLYTGVNPGKHGVFDFLAFEGYDWDVINATHVRFPAIWEVLSERGLRSVVVNVPVTHPPGGIDGAVIPGYTAPEEPACHPEGILEEVREAIGEYRVYPPHGSDVGSEEAIANYRDLIASRGAAFRYLCREFDPEFGFVEFQSTDTVFHELAGDSRGVEAVYRAVDREVGSILGACEPASVFIVSDHGMGPYEDYEFRVNEFLRREGYLEAVAGREGGMPSWGTIHERAQRDSSGAGAALKRALSRAALAGARVGLTSQRAHGLLDRVGLAEPVARVVPTDLIRAATEQVDFAASRAYMRSRTELGVRINLAGREPDGVVASEDYESVRADLIEALSAVSTPDGDPVFETVAPREEVFSGPHLEDAVDVVTVPHDYEQFLSARLLGEPFGEPEEPWNHKREGIIAAVGKGVDSSADLSGAHLFDVAPTVLASLGVPHDERSDGRVLPVIEGVGTERYDGVEGHRRRTDSQAVEDRLSQLGYLE